MKFDDQFVEQIRNSVDIIDLISGYVQLRKRGLNFTALCPFHNEKTPSFSVSASKQIFKCFGCGVGGDIFSFVQQIENLTFPDAVLHLADRYGIARPELKPSDRAAVERRERLLQIMEQANTMYGRGLETNETAQSYLAGRKIDSTTIARFSLGFAAPGSVLLRTLTERGFRADELEACGLVVQSDSGEYYDKFRNRIMFPIQGVSGKTIAFGGRILGDGRPKYLNSPETQLYHKGNNLYGLSTTREAIRQKDFAVLVEGYFDCIVPYQFGITNVVASLGTSLTAGQVQLLGRYTRKVIVNFDPDSAGVSAAARSIDIFLEYGFQVNVLQLPDNDDPDSFLLSHGAEAYLDHMKRSSPFLDFLLARFIAAERNPFSPKGKQEVISQILPYVLKLPSQVERAEYVSRIASRMRIDEALLMGELRKYGPKSREQIPLKVAVRQPDITLAEKGLLFALFEEGLSQRVLDELEPALFEGLSTEVIFKRIVELRNQSEEISVIRLREALEEQDREWFDRLMLAAPDMNLSEVEVKGCITAIQSLQLDRLSRAIQEEIAREAREGGASERLDELLIRKEKIQRQRQQQ
ncbi:MAG: DNA primase [Acidobacteriota bacterium]|nr:MAG: DNA primase [Acidobacteriota bacterium]